MAQLNNELAEREMIKQFRHDNTWLGELRPKNNWVSNDVIKIPVRGAAPEVLIDNTMYPIGVQKRTDDFITASLHKYDTENTAVTDDELYALAYEKVNDVQLQHRETLEDTTAEHALHAIAIGKETNRTPILTTTGELVGGRRRLVTKDLIELWKNLGDLHVPKRGRVIVLSNEHVADLMVEDSGRSKSWGADFQTGNLGVMHVGFKLWAADYNPLYKRDGGNGNIWTRQGFDAVDGRPGSVVFYKNNAIKATGSVKRYAIAAENNPRYRQNEIGFRLWFGAWGIKDEGFAAIVSAGNEEPETPVVNFVHPDTVAEDDTIVISGYGLQNVEEVFFGTDAAKSFQVESDNSITAVVPDLENGAIDVTVVSPGGTSDPKTVTIDNE